MYHIYFIISMNSIQHVLVVCRLAPRLAPFFTRQFFLRKKLS